MTHDETPRKPDHVPFGDGMGKSIFPTFEVNVPMPIDTAVPGSYNKQPPQSSPVTAAAASDLQAKLPTKLDPRLDVAPIA